MKIKILFCLFVLFLVGFFTKTVFADKTIDDYNYQLEQYRGAYNAFTTAKGKYLQYQSLSAKDEAIYNTKQFLIQRNATILTYFQILKTRLRSTTALVGSNYQTKLIGELDQEINWLVSQNDELQSLSSPSLEDLFIISDRLEDKQDSYTSKSYQTLALTFIGKIKDLQQESITLTNLIKQEILKLESQKQGQYKEWISELENKNFLIQKTVEEAEKSQDSFSKKTRESELTKIYEDAKSSLTKANDYLNQALAFQKEIIEGIKK